MKNGFIIFNRKLYGLYVINYFEKKLNSRFELTFYYA